MTLKIKPPALYVADTGTAKGKGVFARQKFAAGDVVEVAPVLVMKTEHEDLPELLKSYVFDWATLAGVPRAQGLALGYGSMYNHANPANLRYVADARESLMRYVAARDIQAGEELTINYNAVGGVHEWPDDNWFERMDITPIGDSPA
jgi:uncharacterized protein